MKNKISIFIIFFISAFIVALPNAGRAGVTDWFKGWSWSSNLGWISFNSTNRSTAVDYGVTVHPESGNSVTGWAWSTNVGWICFGSTCINSNNSALCPAQWSSFLGTSSPAAGIIVSTTPYELTGWARLFSQDYATDSSLTTAERCNQGWISLNCSNKGTCGTINYYVNVYASTGFSLNGYAWSSITPAKYGGLGWIRFDPYYVPTDTYQVPEEYEGTSLSIPWLQVVYGSLYSKGNVSTFTPFAETLGTANVAYCIDTGVGATVTSVSGGSCSASIGGTSVNAEQKVNVNIPKSSTNYANLFGKIDLPGISSGRYGTIVHLSSSTNLTNQLPSVLAGQIYETPTGPATYTLSAKTFNNASGGQNGSGLIIVHGNLNITGDVLYQVGTITKLSQLASLGILVLDDGSGSYGNVTIDPSVRTVSANLFAEGLVSTGTTGVVANDKALTINGVTVAKQYDLQRLYAGTPGVPSEKFVNDGRIIANTPPGMNDIVQSLPIVTN